MMTKQYSTSCCKYIGEGKVNLLGKEASSDIRTSEGSTAAVPNGKMVVVG